MPNRTTTAEDTVPVTAADDEAVTTALAAQTEQIATATAESAARGRASVAALETAVESLTAPAAAAPAAADPSPDFAALQARIDALERQNEEIASVAAAERQRAADLQREKELAELAALAAEGGWHGEPAAHAEFLYALSPEQRDFYTQQMNATAEQITAGGLFTAVGTTNPGGSFADPDEELTDKAKALAAERDIAFPAALAIVRKANPELDAAYRARNRA